MWNEAFAEYSDALFQRLAQTPHPGTETPAARAFRDQSRELFTDFSLATASDTIDERQSAVGYGKGPIVLRVLEAQIGQPAMLKSMATFAADHVRGTAAEWPEFEAAVDKVTGRNLRWFFAEWVDRAGLPVVALDHVDAQPAGDGDTIQGDIVQDGTPYRLRVPVLLETRDGQPVRDIIEVTGPVTHFELRADSPPVRLILDPDGVLPLVRPAGEAGAGSTIFSFR
jgi:hypothetical protein